MAQTENVNTQSPNANNQARGKDLKNQMKESAEKGAEFRSENQSADKIEGQNNPESKNPSPEESGE